MPVNDRDLEEYLKRNSALSREYQNLVDDGPPTELQRAVLARAQEAIEREKRGRKPPPARRWMPVFALAASIVLASLVVLEIGLHQHRLLPGTSLQRETQSPADGVTILLNMPSEPSPPGAVVADQAAPKMSEAPQRKAEERTRQRREFDVEQAPSAPAASAPEEKKQADKLEPTMTTVTSMRHLRTPEEWLAAIDDLRKQGKTKEADEEIAAFHKVYPQIKVPSE